MTDNQESTSNELFIPVIPAALFILIVVSLVWITQIKPITDQGFVAPPIAAASEAEVADTSAASAESVDSTTPIDIDMVIAAINKGGCVACHTIPNIPDAIGQVGPNLSNIGVDGATRREGYSAEEYIRESLLEPNAFIAPDCPFGPCIAGTMPNLTLDESEIEVLASFLSTLGQ